MHQNVILKDFNFIGKPTIIRLINKYYSTIRVSRGDYDIFHPTYYDPYFLEKISNKPFVLTVHDMIHEKYPQFSSNSVQLVSFKKKLLVKSKHIISVSENTKKDILEYYKVDPEKITVIPHGSSFDAIISNNSIKLPKDYLLFVGNRSAYKNYLKFIRAVSSLVITYKIHIICMGGPYFSTEEQLLHAHLNIQNKVHYCSGDDSVLKTLYQNALAFVFPSLYEGFGIPILEAFSCGCPVICSKRSSFPEIAGNAVEFFDPEKIESIRESVEKIITSEEYRYELITKGKERGKFFSWKTTADMTKDVYKDILS